MKHPSKRRRSPRQSRHISPRHGHCTPGEIPVVSEVTSGVTGPNTGSPVWVVEVPAFRLKDPGLPRLFSTPPEQLPEYHRDYLPLLGFTSCSAEAARNQLSESTNCPTNSLGETQEPSVNSEPALGRECPRPILSILPILPILSIRPE